MPQIEFNKTESTTFQHPMSRNLNKTKISNFVCNTETSFRTTFKSAERTFYSSNNTIDKDESTPVLITSCNCESHVLKNFKENFLVPKNYKKILLRLKVISLLI
jgi:hypothetical protein